MALHSKRAEQQHHERSLNPYAAIRADQYESLFYPYSKRVLLETMSILKAQP